MIAKQEQETQFDHVLRKMLGMQPQPRKKPKAKKPKATKKKPA